MTFLLIIAGALLLLLCIPVTVQVDGRGAEAPRVLVSWGPIPIPLGRRSPRSRPEKRAKKRSDLRRWLRPDAIRRLARRLVRAVHPWGVDLEVLVSLDDPADTGMLFAPAWPWLTSALPRGVRVRPDFCSEGVSVFGHGRWLIVPGEVLVAVLAFVLATRGRGRGGG